MDQPFVWGLLLKPFIGLLLLAGVFGVPILLVRLLRPIFPEGKLKDLLFRERGTDSAASSTDAEQRVFNDPPLIGRESGQDSTRL